MQAKGCGSLCQGRNLCTGEREGEQPLVDSQRQQQTRACVLIVSTAGSWQERQPMFSQCTCVFVFFFCGFSGVHARPLLGRLRSDSASGYGQTQPRSWPKGLHGIYVGDTYTVSVLLTFGHYIAVR